MNNYKNKYLKIYFWQILSFCLNFLSMFVVTPLITNMPVVYGIYTVCISLTIFLNYADLGFLLAGEKFAAESFSTGDFKSEKAFVGTSLFIYATVCLFVCLGICICAWNPSLLIKDIDGDYSQYNIARKLLLILALSIPFTIIQKYVQIIYRIRLEDYKIQRVGIFGSLLVILSVPFIFFNDQYDIIGYYIFSQTVACFIPICYLIRSRKIGYGFLEFLRSIRFDKAKFVTMKGLALSGFVSCICWLLSYEMDMILISTLLGAEMVALYAIARSANNMIRSVLGIIYSPYSIRFNYFVGDNNYDGLKDFYFVLVRLLGYVIVIPIIVLAFFAKPFVISWVGFDYLGAVFALQLLLFGFLPNYFSSPAGNVVVALNNFKGILIVSILQLVVFYLCTFSLIWFIDVNSVALAKCMTNFVGAVYYIILVSNLFGISIWSFVRKIRILNMIVPCLVTLILCYFAMPFVIDVTKSPSNMLLVIFVMGSIILISLFSAFLIDKLFRKELLNVICTKK